MGNTKHLTLTLFFMLTLATTPFNYPLKPLSDVVYKKKPPIYRGFLFCVVVIRIGFEPMTPNLEGLCSIQLSYRTDLRGAK
jgi:hypothetical protein